MSEIVKLKHLRELMGKPFVYTKYSGEIGSAEGTEYPITEELIVELEDALERMVRRDQNSVREYNPVLANGNLLWILRDHAYGMNRSRFEIGNRIMYALAADLMENHYADVPTNLDSSLYDNGFYAKYIIEMLKPFVPSNSEENENRSVYDIARRTYGLASSVNSPLTTEELEKLEAEFLAEIEKTKGDDPELEACKKGFIKFAFAYHAWRLKNPIKTM